MSRTLAAELARLKIAYQGWLIERAAEGTGFAAQLRDERGGLRAIYAPTVAELKTALARAEAEAER